MRRPGTTTIEKGRVDMMRRGTGLAILATIGVLFAFTGPAAARANASFFGVNYTFQDIGQKDLHKMGQGHVKSVRWTISWPRVQKTEGGPFDWSEPDKVIGRLAGRGIRVLPVLVNSPHFAAPTTATPPLGSKAARSDWKRFVSAAVARYGHGGGFWSSPAFLTKHAGKVAVPVTAWQIWNEPNLPSHFQPRPSPHKYAKLLRLAHGAVKSQDSSAKVVFAGMPGYANIKAWKFLGRTYATHGIARKFDVASIHPYAPNLKILRGEIGKIRKTMRKHGDGSKPLWVTEIGWGSAHPDQFRLNKGKHGQKRMLKQSFRLFKHKRHHWHLKHVFWFDFRDPKTGSPGCSFCGSAGLLTYNHHPKPSWRAFTGFTGG
jgi:hypothetical protein